MPQPVEPAQDELIALGLDAAIEGLSLVARETLESPWICVGLVLALHGSLIAALSGYDTASYAHVRLTNKEGRLAVTADLLWRAGSGDYLNEPERLSLKSSERKTLKTLIGARNAFLHPSDPPRAATAKEVRQVLNVLTHLLVTHPTFKPSHQPARLARLQDLLRMLDTRVPPPALGPP